MALLLGSGWDLRRHGLFGFAEDQGDWHPHGARARRHELTAMFVRHGILLTTAGAAIGLVVAFAVMRLMSVAVVSRESSGSAYLFSGFVRARRDRGGGELSAFAPGGGGGSFGSASRGVADQPGLPNIVRKGFDTSRHFANLNQIVPTQGHHGDILRSSAVAGNAAVAETHAPPPKLDGRPVNLDAPSRSRREL